MSAKDTFNLSQLATSIYWRLLFFRITGGRPMKKIQRDGFFDHVSGKRVEFYEDKFGRTYMADSGSWSFFRVRTEE